LDVLAFHAAVSAALSSPLGGFLVAAPLTGYSLRLVWRPARQIAESSMTFEQFAATVRDWQSWMTPAQVRSATGSILGIADLPRGTTLDAALAMVAKGEPALVPAGKAEPKPPQRQAVNSPAKARSGTGQGSRGRPSARAQALVREQLKHGPRSEASVMAAASFADISERTLIAARERARSPHLERSVVDSRPKALGGRTPLASRCARRRKPSLRCFPCASRAFGLGSA